jgi:two-component system cell cycle sensor histidine kinase PleC
LVDDMLNASIGGKTNSNSLLSEYSTLLGDAILRHRTRVAEHSARIEAELASKVKSEFIANMSHELRTPLNTIIGFSKLVSEHDRRPLQDGEIVQYAQLIHDAARHLLSVINDILDISKIQSGKYTLDSREIDLNEVLVSCTNSFILMAREAGVTLQHRTDVDVPLVRGDAVKLRQVFTNLFSNAIKFTRPGGQVTVEAMRLPGGGAGAVVRDTGVGMTEEEIRIAFTPFGQVDGTRSRWREGTGLGLPIAKALVELHGGRLEVQSEKSKGTEIAVIFPPGHEVSVTQGQDPVLDAGAAG